MKIIDSTQSTAWSWKMKSNNNNHGCNQTKRNKTKRKCIGSNQWLSSVNDAVASPYSLSGASFSEQSHLPDNSMKCTHENAFVPYITARYRDKRSDAISVSSCWIGGQWTLVRRQNQLLSMTNLSERKEKNRCFSIIIVVWYSNAVETMWLQYALGAFSNIDHALRCAWQRQRHWIRASME